MSQSVFDGLKGQPSNLEQFLKQNHSWKTIPGDNGDHQRQEWHHNELRERLGSIEIRILTPGLAGAGVQTGTQGRYTII